MRETDSYEILNSKLMATKEYSTNTMEIKNHQELVKTLNNIKGNHITKLEPSFSPLLGLTYPEPQNRNLQEQLLFLEKCEEIGILKSKPYGSVMKCDSCSSHKFCTRLICTLCRSSNVIRGTTIQHDSCGNIDFDYKYMTSHEVLVCEKCNRRLKAIGLDYSTLGYFYKCHECKAMLPNIEQQYICIECGKRCSQDELRILQLYSYTFNTERLDEALNYGNYLLSVVEELDRFGIKCALSGSIVGNSKMQHTFALVVYNEKNLPVLVVDVIEYNNKEELLVLSFIAKCLDAGISNKILLAIPDLKAGLRELANINRIIVVEEQTTYEAAMEVTQAITDLYNRNENTRRDDE